MQTGEEFPIFQDRNDIAWGQNWQQRIDQALDAVTLLLVVITPGFFRSPVCRAEVERFAARERDLGRQDLILPMYYVSTPELDEPERRDADELARLLASRQFADWRELRFESVTSPVVRKALAQLASRMRDTFWQVPEARPTQPPDSAAGDESQQAGEPLASVRTTAKAEPPTHVVDAYQRGDFATVSEAIAAAQPGDRILVRPGLYQEGLVVAKPLEILGDGPVGDIEVRAFTAPALTFTANIGRVTNLTLRQAGGSGFAYCVDIAQGRLALEGCDISSQGGGACVAIRDGADPRLRCNIIHHGKYGGVFVFDNGLGTLEDNDIFANASSGVTIKAGGDPTLRRNTVHDNGHSGVFVYDNGLGTLEDNDIFANTLAGVGIQSGGNPTVRRNRIHDGKSSGVHVYENGLGTLEDNDIFANTMAGVRIRTGVHANANAAGGNPTVRGNRINRNGAAAVRIDANGRGIFEDNDLTDNVGGAWDIADASKGNVTVTRERNRE